MWAVKPEYLVSDMLFSHLTASEIFLEVRRSLDVDEPDFIINGTIRALEEYDNQDEWYAHLAMNMNLQDNRTKKILWSREWDYRKKVSNLETIYVVRGLSELLELINNEAIADIYSVMNGYSKPLSGIKNSVAKESTVRDTTEMEVLPPPGEIE
jgi:ABC-type uncharacterized transport system auxiliary subunit